MEKAGVEVRTRVGSGPNVTILQAVRLQFAGGL